MNTEEFEIDELAPWLVIVLTLIGGGLRLFLLSNIGVRLDETFSLWLANHSVVDMLQWMVKIDQHPPLYNLLLHYWIAFNGHTPYDIRLLSVLFAAGTIPIVYLIGKRLSGVMMGLAAAMLLALSPFNIRFAQETGMYTCLMFNAAVAIYALVRLLTDSRSVQPIGSQFREYVHAWSTSKPVASDSNEGFSYQDKSRYLTGWRARIFRHRWLPIQSIETDLAWVAFIVFSAATLLSDNTAVFFILATNIFVLSLMLFQKIKRTGLTSSFQAPSFWNWVKAQIVIFVLWSPWIFAFIQQVSRVFRESLLPKPNWDTVVQMIRTFLVGFTQGQTSQVMMIWILYVPLLFLGVMHYLKKMPRFLYLAALFAIPILGELLVSIRQPIFSDRTLIWTTIPLLLVLASGVAQLRFRLLIILVVGILGTNNLFSAGDYYRFMPQEDWGNVAGFVAKYAEKDDLILFNATLVQIPFDYYFLPYEKQYFLQVEKHGVPVDLFESGILRPKMTDSDIPRLISLLNGHQRVWLVYSHDSYTDPMGLLPQTLVSEKKVIRERDFNEVRVQLFALP